MNIQYNQSICRFYHADSGSSIAGGCTKEYLDSVQGNLETILGENGAPLFSAIPTSITNRLGTHTRKVSVFDAYFFSHSEVGLLAHFGNATTDFLGQVTSKDTDTHFDDCDGWAGQQLYSYYGSSDGSSILTVQDASQFTPGDNVVMDTEDSSYHMYPVTSTDTGNNRITIDDQGVLNGESGSCAPEYVSSVIVTLGGALNDLQGLIDDADATYHSQWLFLGSDIALSDDNYIDITSSHDGSMTNNTSVNIIGYQSNAYDCLPSGAGYFPESMGDGPSYRTALEKAIIGNDITAQQAFGRKIDLSGLLDYRYAFRLYSSTENINMMGLTVYTNKTSHALSYVDLGTLGSVHIRHCAFLVNHTSLSSYGFIRSEDTGNGGAIYDCYGYGCSTITTQGTSSNNSSSHYDIGWNCFERHGNTNENYYSVSFHHNILVNGNWGISTVTHGHVVAFNNLFYYNNDDGATLFAAFVNMNATQGSMTFFNNICCFDKTQPTVVNGEYIKINSGGELRLCDYNLIYDLNGNPWPEAEKLLYGGNDDWQGEYRVDYGIHDIWDKDPQFVDPANWDFRLRTHSPCLYAGRPDLNGHPTHIGPCTRQQRIRSLYGQTNPFYSN